MPKRILDGIIEMIYALDKIAPGTANDDTLLYGVEVKFYNMEVQLDENLETPHKGLFVIGDGSWCHSLPVPCQCQRCVCGPAHRREPVKSKIAPGMIRIKGLPQGCGSRFYLFFGKTIRPLTTCSPPFGKAQKVLHPDRRTVVQQGRAGEAPEHLMLVGFDELHIRAGGPIQNGCKVHLEPPVVGGKAPRGQIVLPLPRHGNVEGHLPQLVGPAAVKQHILAGGRGISEAIADVPAEGNAIHLPGGAAQYHVL